MYQLLKRALLVCVCLVALAGHAIADPFSAACDVYAAGDYLKAAKLFKPLAKHGNANAQSRLGQMYEFGQGVPQDYKEAVKWYRLGAEQGDAIAQNDLGLMYESGRGVPQDYKEAVKWYRFAAEQGDLDRAADAAQNNLGRMYESGQGVPQDYVLAYMWANIAAATPPDREVQQRAAEYRDLIARKMTSQQIAEGQQLARKCTAKKFKGC